MKLKKKKKVQEESLEKEKPEEKVPEKLTEAQWIQLFQNQGIYRYYKLAELKELNSNLKEIDIDLKTIGKVLLQQLDEEEVEEDEED